MTKKESNSNRINLPSTDLKIEYHLLTSLKPNKNNPRTHSKKQIRQIAESIHEFGFIQPILIDEDKIVLAGHGRLEAAKLLGMKRIPTISIEHMTKAQIRVFMIADNKLAENARWDQDLLSIMFQDLSELDPDFDLTLTGFEVAEIDIFIDGPGDSNSDDEPDHLSEIDHSAPSVTRPGDLWKIGKHRLFCGDATKPESYRCLLGKRKAQMVFIDPPYNVTINGNVSGLGSVQHSEFVMASGEMSRTEFTAPASPANSAP